MVDVKVYLTDLVEEFGYVRPVRQGIRIYNTDVRVGELIPKLFKWFEKSGYLEADDENKRSGSLHLYSKGYLNFHPMSEDSLLSSVLCQRCEAFDDELDHYGEFDERGVPTHDREMKELCEEEKAKVEARADTF